MIIETLNFLIAYSDRIRLRKTQHTILDIAFLQGPQVRTSKKSFRCSAAVLWLVLKRYYFGQFKSNRKLKWGRLQDLAQFM